MPNKHVLTLKICYFSFLSDSEEIIHFQDCNKNDALVFSGEDASHLVYKQDIIRFESTSPFLFISYKPEDWQPSGATHGPVVWTQEDGSKWCVTAYSEPQSPSGHALELVIVTTQIIDSKTPYSTSYRIVGLEENPTLTSTDPGQFILARLKSVLEGGMKLLAPPGKPTIKITGL